MSLEISLDKPLDRCIHLKEFLREEGQDLKKAIDEDKWYLSEKANCDVGDDVATRDFLENHFNRFAFYYRRDYCLNRCTDRMNCNIARGYAEELVCCN